MNQIKFLVLISYIIYFLSEDDDKKESIQKKVWQLVYNRYLYDNEEKKLIFNEKIDKELVPSDNFLVYNDMMVKIKEGLG